MLVLFVRVVSRVHSVYLSINQTELHSHKIKRTYTQHNISLLSLISPLSSSLSHLSSLLFSPAPQPVHIPRMPQLHHKAAHTHAPPPAPVRFPLRFLSALPPPPFRPPLPLLPRLSCLLPRPRTGAIAIMCAIECAIVCAVVMRFVPEPK